MDHHQTSVCFVDPRFRKERRYGIHLALPFHPCPNRPLEEFLVSVIRNGVRLDIETVMQIQEIRDAVASAAMRLARTFAATGYERSHEDLAELGRLTLADSVLAAQESRLKADIRFDMRRVHDPDRRLPRLRLSDFES